MNKEYILNKSKELLPVTIKNRRHIHSNPELSFQEFQTAEYIRCILNQHNIYNYPLAETGTVAIIGKGDSCVALRADIDALPIFEETNLEFASRTDGIMHACGHDMHTSMLLTAAIILKENESNLNGCVKLIFQPAEEKIPGGAKLMIEQGVLENPRPLAIFGQHIYPQEQSGTVSTNSGPVLASADELYFTIKGKGSHAAQPHVGSDAILAASNLIIYYQSIISKFKNPLESGVLSVTSIHGGSATNIFPDEVKMMGTLRAYSNDWRFRVHDILRKNSKQIAELYGCTCEVEILEGYPPVVNDNSTTQFARTISEELFGKENTLEFEPKMWAEDFAYFAKEIPACFWLTGVRPAGVQELPPLHNSRLSPDENAMANGVAMLVYSAYKFLESK